MKQINFKSYYCNIDNVTISDINDTIKDCHKMKHMIQLLKINRETKE